MEDPVSRAIQPGMTGIELQLDTVLADDNGFVHLDDTRYGPRGPLRSANEWRC